MFHLLDKLIFYKKSPRKFNNKECVPVSTSSLDILCVYMLYKFSQVFLCGFSIFVRAFSRVGLLLLLDSLFQATARITRAKIRSQNHHRPEDGNCDSAETPSKVKYFAVV